LGAVERAELEELRAEKERLQRANEELRSERQKLNSQIHELQNHNAQLIEDHTRDMLSIKAKETQLIRARTDAEAAEQMVQKQQKEMERLKRELSRAVRATSPPIPDVTEQIYRDSGINGLSERRFDAAGGYGAGYSRGKHASFASSNEDKENGGDLPVRPSLRSPPLSGPGSGIGGRGSPAKEHRESNTPSSGGEGNENWRRAAEVTSQLKARIEMMKVSFENLKSKKTF
jgi:cytoskeleton-associated protein 5